MPAPLRDVLVERGGGQPASLYMVRWLDPCLRLYVAQDWEAEEDRFESQAADVLDLDDTLADVRRVLFSLATPVTLDAHSRLLVKPQLRLHAGLGDSVVWVGQGKYIELWSPERWRAKIEAALNDRQGLREKLARLKG